jgi:hypothetical protein
MSLPDKIGPCVKADIIVSYNDLLIESHHELFLAIDLKADINHPFVKEYDFIHFIKFVEDDSILELLSRFKVLQ